MEDNRRKEIQMRLLSVDEVRFLMSLEKLGDKPNPDTIQIGFSSNVDVDIKNNRFALIFGIRYVVKEDVILECIYKFSFDVVDLAKYISYDENKTMSIKYLMPHFLNVAVGTMRGILVVRTAGTVLSTLPLPMIDIDELGKNLSTKQ